MPCLETWAGFRNFTVEIVIKVVTEIKDPQKTGYRAFNILSVTVLISLLLMLK